MFSPASIFIVCGKPEQRGIGMWLEVGGGLGPLLTMMEHSSWKLTGQGSLTCQ